MRLPAALTAAHRRWRARLAEHRLVCDALYAAAWNGDAAALAALEPPDFEKRLLMAMIDLNRRRAERAARREAEGIGPHRVAVGAVELAIPVLEDWPVEAIDLLRDGRLHHALRAALPDQADQLAAADLTLADVNDLFDEIGGEQGLGGVGNSSASSASSTSGGTTSRPTSSAGTESTSATSGTPAAAPAG